MGKAALYTALRLIFPPECAHCKQSHDKLAVPLCKECLQHLDARPPSELLITFESIGPAQSLISSLKRGYTHAPLLAAYMAIQYTHSAHPLPDLITAVPSSWWRQFSPGAALATQLAKLLDRPFVPLLKRTRQLHLQSNLSREERLLLSSEEFQWKNKQNLRGKTVLLIDDTITTGTTLACCAERLYEASPSKLIKMVCVDQGYLQF